jgi:hypothetical protein
MPTVDVSHDPGLGKRGVRPADRQQRHAAASDLRSERSIIVVAFRVSRKNGANGGNGFLCTKRRERSNREERRNRGRTEKTNQVSLLHRRFSVSLCLTVSSVSSVSGLLRLLRFASYRGIPRRPSAFIKAVMVVWACRRPSSLIRAVRAARSAAGPAASAASVADRIFCAVAMA